MASGGFIPARSILASFDRATELSDVSFNDFTLSCNLLTTLQLLGLVTGSLLGFVAEADTCNSARQRKGDNVTMVSTQNAAALSPDILWQRLGLSLSEKPQGKEGLLAITDRILCMSVNTWDQGFMHKLYSGTNPVGVISELILAVLNANVSWI
jgi:glutamate decarboxylase